MNAPEDNHVDTLEGMQDEGAALDGALPQAENQTAAAPPKTIGMPSAEILRPALAWGAKAFAPNWSVSLEETNRLADTLGAVLDKWVPGGALAMLNHWKEEVALLGCAFAIFSLRLGVPLIKPTEESADHESSQGK